MMEIISLASPLASIFGTRLLTIPYREELCGSCALHLMRQCCSSSTRPSVHFSHRPNLFSGGTIGRSCIPVSILRKWELHLI